MSAKHPNRLAECKNPSQAKKVAKAAAAMKPELRRVKLNGEMYSITVVPYVLLPDYAGLCCDELKEILVQSGQKGRGELDTYLHEALHACAPWADEHWVCTTATELARMLTRLGYSRAK